MKKIVLILFIYLLMGCTTFRLDSGYVLKPYEALFVGVAVGVVGNYLYDSMEP